MMEGKRKVCMPFGTSAATSHIPWHQKEKEIPHLDNITCTRVRQQGTRGENNVRLESWLLQLWRAQEWCLGRCALLSTELRTSQFSRLVVGIFPALRSRSAADMWAHVPWGPRVSGSHCTGTSSIFSRPGMHKVRIWMLFCSISTACSVHQHSLDFQMRSVTCLVTCVLSLTGSQK